MDYLTVARNAENTYEIKKSKFIAKIAPLYDSESGQRFVEEVKKKYKDATHNCYAIVDFPESKDRLYLFSDDGEPSGTAGRQILNTLQKNNIYAVVCVVTRYFGGIKLGTGGLTSAYTKATSLAIEKAGLVLKKESVLFKLTLTYSEHKNFEFKIKPFETQVVNIRYFDFIDLEIITPQSNKEQFLEIIALTLGGDNSRCVIKDNLFASYNTEGQNQT
ncbi:MAG: YigZ family protein [Christensenellaceae bacterium]|jgi:uncharacterized YigZ family protein|nr:YigZ family protein [Christensenellaceae bacterium]